MPAESEHISKAEHNEALYEELTTAGGYADWEITALFYAALHYVDAWLSRSGTHPHAHVQRRSLVSRDPVLHRIYGHYARLDDRSRDARYTAIRFPNGYAQQLHTDQFQPIRDVVRRLLGLP
jgi:hypothetical protein